MYYLVQQRYNNWGVRSFFFFFFFLFNRSGSSGLDQHRRLQRVVHVRQTRILGHGALNRWTRGRRHAGTQLWSVTTPCRRSTNRRPQGKLCVTCRRWPVACVISLHAFPQIQWYTLLASSFCFLFEGGRKLWDRLYTIEFYLK